MTQRASLSTPWGQFEEDRQGRREVGEKEEARSKMCVCVSYIKLDVWFGQQAALWRAAKEGEPAGGCQGVYGPMGSEPDVKNTERWAKEDSSNEMWKNSAAKAAELTRLWQLAGS